MPAPPWKDIRMRGDTCGNSEAVAMKTAERQPAVQATDLVAEGCLDIPGAERFSGMRRSWLYQEMLEGRLAYVTLGRRRLIPLRALRERIAAGLIGM